MKTFPFLKIGSTRIVFLVGRVAFKVVRFRPLYGLYRAIVSRRKKSCNKSFLRLWLGHSLYGIVVNRQEYHYYQNHQDDVRIMPTQGSFLHGIVVTQLRGVSEITTEELHTILACNSAEELRKSDLGTISQYSKHPFTKRIVVVDYGDPRSLTALLRLVV